MYVYLDFLSAKAGDLLIEGVLGQQLFFFVISLHILSVNVSSVHHSSGGLLVLLQHPAGAGLWHFLRRRVVTSQ